MYTVSPCYTGPRYNGSRGILDTLAALKIFCFHTSKIPLLYRMAHTMQIIRTGQDTEERLYPVLHTKFPCYTGQLVLNRLDYSHNHTHTLWYR